jgi:N-acetylmuramoyl-L-alanine amidase
MLAAMIQQELIRVTNRPNRGVKFANFAVLRNNPVPAVLIEAGFISNTAEEVLLNTPQWRKRAAYAVANAVRSYALKK